MANSQSPPFGAVSDLALRRCLERADVARWTQDLTSASEAVAALAVELWKRARRGGPITGTADETLDPKDVHGADSWVRRAMGEEGKSGAARREFASHLPPRLRSLLGLAFGEGGTVGALDRGQLTEVADRLAEMARLVRAAKVLMLGEETAKSGRPTDTAARLFVRDCARSSFPIGDEVSRLLLDLDIEQVDVGDTGADPVKLLTDRLRRKK